MSIRYSLIIPAYNACATIQQCLAAALGQDIDAASYEVIAVDDGSRDDTKVLVQTFPSVRLCVQPHQGPAAARNRGAKEARGDMVIFTDSDCIPERSFIRNIVQPLDADSSIAGAQGSYKTNQKEFVAQFAHAEILQRYERLVRGRFIDFIGTYAACYRKDVFLGAGGFDTSFPAASGEDAEFSYRLHARGFKMVFAPEACVYHRHPASVRQYFKSKFSRGYWRVRLYQKHMHKAVRDSYTPQSLKLQVLGASAAPVFLVLSYWDRWWLSGIIVFLLSCAAAAPACMPRTGNNTAVTLVRTWALIAVRAIAIAAGMLSGLGNGFAGRRTNKY